MKFSHSDNHIFSFDFDEEEIHLTYGCLLECWRLLDEETFLLFFEQSHRNSELLMDKMQLSKNNTINLDLEELRLIYESIFVSMAKIQNWEFSILVGSKKQTFALADEIEVPLLEMMRHQVQMEFPDWNAI